MIILIPISNATFQRQKRHLPGDKNKSPFLASSVDKITTLQSNNFDAKSHVHKTMESWSIRSSPLTKAFHIYCVYQPGVKYIFSFVSAHIRWVSACDSGATRCIGKRCFSNVINWSPTRGVGGDSRMTYGT